MSVYSGVTKSRQVINHLECTTATLSAFEVADLPAAADWVGTLVYVSNGAGGLPVVAFSDGSNWLRCDTRAAVAAA